ncbi:unnamed protein product, partial [Amoebophrya sp. A120]
SGFRQEAEDINNGDKSTSSCTSAREGREKENQTAETGSTLASAQEVADAYFGSTKRAFLGREGTSRSTDLGHAR